MRPEKNEDPSSISPFTMYSRSGKKLFATIPPGPIIGSWANKHRAFYVSGEDLYELFEDASMNKRGTVTVDGTPARMQTNGNQLLVCSAGNVYIDTGTSFFQPIVSFARGNADINGVNVTWKSGDKFTGAGGDVRNGDLFMLVPNLYTVITVDPDGEHLTLDKDAGVLNFYPYQVGSERLRGVMPEFIDTYFIVNEPESKRFPHIRL